MLATRRFGNKWFVLFKDVTKEAEPTLDVDERHIVDGPFDTAEQASGAMVEASFLYEED